MTFVVCSLGLTCLVAVFLTPDFFGVAGLEPEEHEDDVVEVEDSSLKLLSFSAAATCLLLGVREEPETEALFSSLTIGIGCVAVVVAGFDWLANDPLVESRSDCAKSLNKST